MGGSATRCAIALVLDQGAFAHRHLVRLGLAGESRSTIDSAGRAHHFISLHVGALNCTETGPQLNLTPQPV